MAKNQIDHSEGKGIYNTTIKTNEDLVYDTEGFPASLVDPTDMGEEVYGCISHGFGEGSTLENDAETAKKQRKVKRKDSLHFEAQKHSWYEEKAGKTGKAYEECALIPQENMPLVVNSKFPMRFWDGEETRDIPKGAGFTSGTLVRPIVFSKKADKIPDGSLNAEAATFVSLRSYELKDVPIKTAHLILNCCKEISLSGGVSYSLTRENKKCSGVESSKYEVEGEQFKGCSNSGSCVPYSYNIQLTCSSSSQKTTIGMDGSIDITAYRYKQMAGIWGDPKVLDISGNYFYGSLSKKVSYQKISESACEREEDSGPAPAVPVPTIKQLCELEKQTKLSSGCLAYAGTNRAILSADLGENLKDEEISVVRCIKATTGHFLDTGNLPYEILSTGHFSHSHYPGGVIQFSNYTLPQFVSGPSLRAYFEGSGWDNSALGLSEPEDLYSRDCKDETEYENYFNYKSKWNSTGIKATLSGSCGLGLSGVDRYDRTQKSCKCGDSCEDCKTDFGKLALQCKCTPMCSPFADPTHPCTETLKPECDALYSVSLEIGKYVGVQMPQYRGDGTYYNIAAVPLSLAMDTKKENLTLWWNSELAMPFEAGWESALGIHLGRESADHSKPSNNSIYRYETKEVGVLRITCDDWTAPEVPIWTVFKIGLESSCVGYSSGSNTYATSIDAEQFFCAGCDNNNPDCCDEGCGGNGETADGCCNVEPCGALDPCGYAVQAVDSRSCPLSSCNGTCTDLGDGACCDEADGDPIHCAPNKVTSEFKEMGCYGDAQEEDKVEAKINLSLEFKLFKEME